MLGLRWQWGLWCCGVVALAGCHAPVAPADATSATDVAADSGGDVSAPADTTAVAALDVAPDADITATPTAIPLTELLHALGRVRCAMQVACTPGMVRDEVWLETCALSHTDFEQDPDLEPLLNRIRLTELGRLNYDGLAAAQCLAAATCGNADGWRPLVCEWLAGLHITRPGQALLPGQCAKVFSGGQAPVGADCDDDAECAKGRCWGWPAICRLRVAIGAPCGSDAPCEDNAVCRKNDAGQQRCAAVGTLEVGATCDRGADCDVFFPTCAACDPGTGWCDAGGHCAALLPAGATCTEFGSCQAGLTCMDEAGGICAAPLADGAICKGYDDCDATKPLCQDASGADTQSTAPSRCWHDLNSTPCGSGSCAIGTYCADGSGAGTCAKDLQLGEICKSSWDVCDLGTCRSVDKVCSPYKPCASPSCALVNCKADGTCPLHRIGDSCSDDSDCYYYSLMPNGWCFDGVCRAENPARWLLPVTP